MKKSLVVPSQKWFEAIKIFAVIIFLSYTGNIYAAMEQIYQSKVFTSSKQCKEKCHEEIYRQWATSMHAYAWKDPLFQKSFKASSKASNGKSDQFCIKCHAPVAYLANEVPPVDGSKMTENAKDGNQCDICHIISEIDEPIGNANFTVKPGQYKRGPRKDGQTKSHKIKYSEIHLRSSFCGSCHELVHPETGVSLMSTYSEWQDSPYNEGEDEPEENVECQHCHMSPGIVKLVKTPGQSSPEGIIRDNIPTHYFVGGNTVISKMLGQGKHEKEALKRLRMAAKVEVVSTEKEADKISFTVEVTNVGAGHSIPTGMNMVRRVWLEVSVLDGSMKNIFTSGVQEDNGKLPENTVVYETAYADKEGKRTYSIWNAAKIISDTRLKAKKKKEHQFTVPVSSPGPYSIKAILRYQNPVPPMAWQHYARDEIKIPAISMAEATATVE